jgi:hypothetical protein
MPSEKYQRLEKRYQEDEVIPVTCTLIYPQSTSEPDVWRVAMGVSHKFPF